MGLFDALRGRGTPERVSGPLGDTADEPVQLVPSPGARFEAEGSTLSFGIGSVSEIDSANVRRNGEYTIAGRFLLSAPLQPSVVITLTSPLVADTQNFTARRTDIRTRLTVDLHYSRST